ncbi:MAG: outer membrane protein assembly factor BamC [Sphingobacteriia bacterium]|nr:outer membrane protein assembly factor BamC [Sphingobacteriia bacterium]NCC40077.1 outer membrane protein assembly factor BamC [Gammaproteobacteria bacterium]
MKRLLNLRAYAWLIGGFLGAWVTLVLTGCSSGIVSDAVPDQRLAYKKQREAAENLEIPPDLTAGTFDDALDIPPAGAMTYSEYRGTRSERVRVATAADVLPEIPDVELKRRDAERWLEVRATPQQVWPKAIAFWREQGILLVEQNPTIGVMRTDWLDNRAEIRQDFLTRMISKVMEGVYATSTRDQYSLRIEPGDRPGSTEIHLTHRGMEERLVTNAIGDGSRTIWEPSPRDPEKEAEMLRRLMVFLGAPSQRAAALTTSGGGSAPGAGAPAGPSARLVTDANTPALVISQDTRSAWRVTGSALQAAGFAVEDRDMTRGVFYVRYAGEDVSAEDKPGLMSRLAFWRKSEVDPVKQYQIIVEGDDRESRISVRDADGSPAPAETSRQILVLMQEKMR